MKKFLSFLLLTAMYGTVHTSPASTYISLQNIPKTLPKEPENS